MLQRIGLVTKISTRLSRHNNCRGFAGFAEMFKQTRNQKSDDGVKPIQIDSAPRKEVGDNVLDINCQEELQPEWAALERRVKDRKSLKIGEKPQGRTALRQGSAWDAENI